MTSKVNIDRISSAVQVNVPFTQLWDQYLQRFIEQRLNPEIGIDAAALDRFGLSDFDAVAQQLAAAGLSITLHAPFFDLAPGSIDPQIRAVTQKRFDQVLALIPVFRPRSVVCHAGFEQKRYGFVRDQWFENSAALWDGIARRLNRYGCRLMLENVFEHGPEDMQPLFDALRSLDVGLCLDVGHQAAFSRTSLTVWLEQLGRDIGQVHLHDNNGQGDQHLAMGRGTIDFPSLFQQIRKLHRRPPIITLEPHQEPDLFPSLAYLSTVWPWT